MILNLTQHPATPEQIAAGVVDLPAEDATYVRQWLTADTLESVLEWTDMETDAPDHYGTPDERAAIIADRAAELTDVGEPCEGAAQAMIGGAPWLMAPLERELRQRGIEPLYAFSRRESVEEAQTDGSVRKVNVFRHAGFVPASVPL